LLDSAPTHLHRILLRPRDCAEVFVSLALTDRLLNWEGEGTQKKGFRHDRKFELGDTWYLEVEKGNQAIQKLRVKLSQYVSHYRETKEPFHVLFTVQDEPSIEQLIYLFEGFKLGSHYAAVVFEEFVRDPLNASLTTRFDTFSLSNHHPTE
jgi:hypothetical protein